MLWLVQGKPSGSASLTSPGFSFSKGKVCFRLTYQLIWLAALSIYTKSYNKNDGVSVIKEVITLTQNKDSFKEKDVLMDVPSSFQVRYLLTLFTTSRSIVGNLSTDIFTLFMRRHLTFPEP